MFDAFIIAFLLAASVGAVITFVVVLRIMHDFPDTRKRLLPVQIGILFSLPLFLVGSVGRLMGWYHGPTIWLSTYGGSVWLYWFGFAFPLIAWVHGDIRRKREELERARAKRVNGIKEQIKQEVTT